MIERVYNHVKIKKIEKVLYYKREMPGDMALGTKKHPRKEFLQKIRRYSIHENVCISPAKVELPIEEVKDDEIEETQVTVSTNQETNPPITPVKPGVSILITAYKSQNFIEECLDSIENQTYFKDNNEFEVLLGIDACEETLKKVQEIRHKYRNISVYMMKENKGPYVVLNTLLDLVKYDNLIIFGSDDVMMRYMISEIMSINNKHDIIQFKFKTFTKDVHLPSRGANMFAIGAIFIKKSVFDIAGGYQAWRCSGDYELMTRVQGRVRMTRIAKELFFRRDHPNSLSQKSDTALGSPLRLQYNKSVRHYQSHENIKIDKIANEYEKIEKNTQYITSEHKKINVIISAYKCAEFIEECLDSVQNQTYKANKIFLGIDGCKETLEKVKQIRHKYSNLELYNSTENNGPYMMFNALLAHVPDNEYIQIFGADDKMNPNMLQKMSKNDIWAISNNDGVLFAKKEIFKLVGGFRDWRCGADSDILFRIRYATKIVKNSEPQYFFRREHSKQLTKNPQTNLTSILRAKYIKIFEENKNSKNPIIYIEPICSKIQKIYNIFAAIPVNGRHELLPHTIERLLHKCGVTKVYCMGDNDEDRKICEASGAEWINHKNTPLGKKWNAGLKKAIESNINYDAFLFVGSSDWISEDWIDTYTPFLKEYDMVGTTNCYYLDININGDKQVIHWSGYTNYRVGEAIGIGRLYSMNIIKKLNGNVFPNDLDKSMDYMSLQNILSHEGKVKSFVADSAKTISISTNKWINKHDFQNEKRSPNSTIIENADEWLKIWFPEAFNVFYSKKIKQVYVSKSVIDFKEQLKSKFNLNDYNNLDEPVFIFGMHRKEDYEFAIKHIPYKVIFWCGSDAMNMKPEVKLIKNVTHLAGSKFVSDDLTQNNIEHLFMPVTTASFDLPLYPRGNNIYFYYSKGAENFYGMDILDEIKARTGLNIVIARTDTYSRKELIENVYKNCFVGLRLTPHDGVPTTGCELGLMGRRIIHNGNQPNALNYKNIDDVIRLIQEEYNNRHEDNSQIAKDMKAFLDIGEEWLNVKNNE